MSLQKILPIIFVLFLSSCNSGNYVGFGNNSEDAKLTLLNSANKKAFSFIVSEDFVMDHEKAEPSKIYPKMNVAELKLLMKLLKDNKYCINKSGDLSFKISSKQEKVYDITFSRLIEQSYNAKPVSPVTYFGECL